MVNLKKFFFLKNLSISGKVDGKVFFPIKPLYFIYSLIVYLLFKYMIKQLGIYAILIFSLNFIHFLRHGIDIFLIKIIFQFLLVFVFRIKIISQQKNISN